MRSSHRLIFLQTVLIMGSTLHLLSGPLPYATGIDDQQSCTSVIGLHVQVKCTFKRA
ncbi:hypothetical protein M758_10G018600 [Ceratodon purpureus]|nr:hypothetical protein M758_10G018600 [Ceratodon purpureus]